jgi:phosphoribosylformimino-5-aminoimidazole carboxamide ribotide isomerase
MILYPAIDLKDGQCVRLLHGEMAAATVFNTDPAAQARSFAQAGLSWLHIVDLNGAFAGKPINGAAVESIRKSVDSSIQLGGGIRDMATIEHWLELGLDRVILGTAAVKNPQLVRDACKAFYGKVAVGIDAKDGKVATEGWAEVSDMTVIELAKRFEDAGVCAIIHTDIARDGAMQGPNLAASIALADAVQIPIIVSGGVSSLEDLQRIRETDHQRLDGVIVGRALYEGLDVAKARDILAA